MKNSILCFTLFALFCFKTQAQQTYATTDTNYVSLVTKAFDFLEKNDCKPCLEKYEAAFALSQKSILSRLRAAICAYDCKNEARFRFHVDFAFEKFGSDVENIIDGGYPEFEQRSNTDFDKIIRSKLDSVFTKMGLNMSLRKDLAILQKDDQELRQKLSDTTLTNDQKQALWQKINVLDSLNLLKLEKILDTHGYPGKSVVGERYGSTAWLIIQHSNIATMKKYYTIIKEAAQKDELRKSSYALFEDRYRMWSGEKQVYGSQVKTDKPGGKPYIHPIEDEENVNKRREEIGMEPLENYAKRFGIDYKVPTKKDN
jgi:hypothetical protein